MTHTIPVSQLRGGDADEIVIENDDGETLISVQITMSALDGTLVVQVDTPGTGEDAKGPFCRIYLNESTTYENPPWVTKSR